MNYELESDSDTPSEINDVAKITISNMLENYCTRKLKLKLIFLITVSRTAYNIMKSKCLYGIIIMCFYL